MVLGSNPDAATSLRNFGNSVYRPLCQCLSEETHKSRRSLNNNNNNNGRNGSCLAWLATSLEEKRRWLIIN